MKMEYVTLNNGIKMPVLGYGVYQVTNEECERCVLEAISVGYRSIDTAQAYGNEEAVGNAVRKCNVPREELSIHYGKVRLYASLFSGERSSCIDFCAVI